MSINDLEEVLIRSKKLTNDANEILTDFSSKLTDIYEQMNPIRNREQALTTASQNIKLSEEIRERTSHESGRFQKSPNSHHKKSQRQHECLFGRHL